VPNRGIRDLTGLQFATNLDRLYLRNNQISDISPLASLINLQRLWLENNPVFDLSPLRGLENLTHLWLNRTQVSDLSPLAGLLDLELLEFGGTNVSDLSPIRGLINLELLAIEGTNVSNLSPIAGFINLKRITVSSGSSISDLSPLAGLTQLEEIGIHSRQISDLTPLAGLTQLEEIGIHGGQVSDLTPLAGLTNLKQLFFSGSDISDLSPLAGLAGLVRMDLAGNNISDVSPLAGLTNLRWLILRNNQISDISPLDGIRKNLNTLVWHDNPGFPEVGPSIEGPWLWVVLPNTRLSSSKDLLSETSGGAVTEMEVATHGVIEGQLLGNDVWTYRRLPPTGKIEDMLGRFIHDGVIYGTVSLYSPRQQVKTLYVGSSQEFKVWLNGALIYESLRYHASHGYTDFLPVTLKQGRNVLLVALRADSNGFFGFEPGTEYTVANPGVSYTFSKIPIHLGDTFTLDIGAKDVFDLAGWQFDIAFDPAALEAIDVSEGDFLKKDSGTTFFQSGNIDNISGRITGLSAARLSTQGMNGTGPLLHVRFRAKSAGETELALHKFQFGSVTGDSIPAGPHQVRIVVEEQLATGDVNRDGVVSILDLILVAQQLGKRVSAGSPVDVNRDGIVSILDLIRVAQGIAASPTAPLVKAGSVDAATIEAWIAQARLEDDGSLAFKQGIENLQNLLASLIPEETALLANYPNPFNPETWIPYQLAESAEVILTIYDINGQLVRRLSVGHQAAGMYQSRSRAVYWDGRNQRGEFVASGLYFYTLTAGQFTATRKMLILK